MKIYTRVVIDIETGRTLEEESFEYNGPLSLADPASALAVVGSVLGESAFPALATKLGFAAPAIATGAGTGLSAATLGSIGSGLGGGLGMLAGNAMSGPQSRHPVGLGLAGGLLRGPAPWGGSEVPLYKDLWQRAFGKKEDLDTSGASNEPDPGQLKRMMQRYGYSILG